MGKRILVIDDETNIRLMTRLTLESEGYETDEAGDGEEGLEKFGDGSAWDAVLLDQKMPGMDGLETLRRIKEVSPEARVVMVTAFASVELAVDAMKLGATDFIRKPMTPEVVRNAVTAAPSKPAAATLRGEPRAGRGAPSPLIETITMNGFRILRPSDVGDFTPDKVGERRFIVKSPDGREQQVIINIGEESIGYVERMTHRRLPPESSYWTQRAQRTLAEYVWRECRTPPGGRMSMREVDRDELVIAARWEDTPFV